MENPQRLTKAQRKALQKSEWQKDAEREKRNEDMKKYGLWGGLAVLIAAAILGLAIFVNSPSSTTKNSLTAPLTSKYEITTGDKKSKVTLIEYADFQCPGCAQYYPMVKKLLEDEKDMHFSYRFFPLTNIHQNAQISAQAAFAANKQGKFWEMSDMLYSNQQSWAESANAKTIFASYAQDLKLDSAKFLTDMNSDEAKTYVDNSLKEAISLGLNSTPSFFINGVKIQSPPSYEAFKKLIDDEFKK